ncbi:hypothetical protein AZH51_08105 [Branchiibius sp. NY16-3462-2]|nr:hypothetical protein AZH51_08105 [Branchiibius sp. NY16-3462-2]
MRVIREQGISAVSTRTISAAGGVNQALIFYHFGSVDGLVAAACLDSTAQRVALMRPELDAVSTFTELVEVAGRLHRQEREVGNVTVLAQVLAGSHGNPALAEATGAALGLWNDQVRTTLTRLLRDSPLSDVLDAGALTDLVSATFIGLELTEPTRADSATLEQALAGVSRLAATLDGLGPVARRALRSALRASR